MDTISFADLRCFLAISTNGSLTKAATHLRSKKGAVSKALARLERELGVKLFERSTRRLAITQAGAVLRGRAESLVADVEALRSELERDHLEAGGTLTLAAPPELGVALARGAFASYLERHPRARVRLKLDYGYHDLFDPEIDLALRVANVKDDSLVARPLWTFRRVLVASPAFLADHVLKTPDDLSRVPCLGFDEHGFSSTWPLTDGKTLRSIDVEGRFAARSYPAALAAARVGVGVAFLPAFVAASEIETRELVRVLPRWGSDPVTVFLVHRPGHSKVRRVSAFIEHVLKWRELPRGLRPIKSVGASAER